MKFKLSDLGAVHEFLRLPGRRANELKRTLAIMAYGRLTAQAPVCTGRYRWGFNCSINGIDFTIPVPPPKEFTKSKTVYYDLDKERAKKKFVSVAIGDDLIISNSLPYAEALENGHSGHAPSGVFRVVIPQLKEDLKIIATSVKGEDL